MKFLIFILSLLLTQGLYSQSVDQTDTVMDKKVFSRLDFGVRGTHQNLIAPSDETKLDGLTFDIRSVIIPNVYNMQSSGDPVSVSLGEFQVEVDVYGFNRPDGSKVISLRKFSAALATFLFGARHNESDSDNGYARLSIIDFQYERMDAQLTTKALSLLGGEVVIRPTLYNNRSKNRPLKLIVGASFNILGVATAVNSDPLKFEKYDRALDGLEKGWARLAIEGAVVTKGSIKAGLDWKKRFMILASHTRGAYAPEGFDYKPYDDLRIRMGRREYSLKVPLNTRIFGSDMELVSSYIDDKFKFVRFSKAAEQYGDPSHHEFERRSNKRIYFGVNFKFSRD